MSEQTSIFAQEQHLLSHVPCRPTHSPPAGEVEDPGVHTISLCQREEGGVLRRQVHCQAGLRLGRHHRVQRQLPWPPDGESPVEEVHRGQAADVYLRQRQVRPSGTMKRQNATPLFFFFMSLDSEPCVCAGAGSCLRTTLWAEMDPPSMIFWGESPGPQQTTSCSTVHTVGSRFTVLRTTEKSAHVTLPRSPPVRQQKPGTDPWENTGCDNNSKNKCCLLLYRTLDKYEHVGLVMHTVMHRWKNCSCGSHGLQGALQLHSSHVFTSSWLRNGVGRKKVSYLLTSWMRKSEQTQSPADGSELAELASSI